MKGRPSQEAYNKLNLLGKAYTDVKWDFKDLLVDRAPSYDDLGKRICLYSESGSHKNSVYNWCHNYPSKKQGKKNTSIDPDKIREFYIALFSYLKGTIPENIRLFYPYWTEAIYHTWDRPPEQVHFFFDQDVLITVQGIYKNGHLFTQDLKVTFDFLLYSLFSGGEVPSKVIGSNYFTHPMTLNLPATFHQNMKEYIIGWWNVFTAITTRAIHKIGGQKVLQFEIHPLNGCSQEDLFLLFDINKELKAESFSRWPPVGESFLEALPY